MSSINFTERFNIGIDAIAKGIEVWFFHPEFEGIYEVSNFGHMRSVDRKVNSHCGPRPIRGKLLSPTTINSGYFIVCMRNNSQPPQRRLLHRAVLETFVGPCPEGMQCRHLDGNKKNNRLDNICWGTNAEDHEDRRRLGTLPQGEDVYNSKLSNEEVIILHQKYEAGMTQSELAQEYGMTQTGIGKILRGVTYKNSQPANKAKLRKGSPGERNGRARKITYNGETLLLKDWAARLDISPNTLRDRIKAGGIEYALSTGRKRPRPTQ